MGIYLRVKRLVESRNPVQGYSRVGQICPPYSARDHPTSQETEYQQVVNVKKVLAFMADFTKVTPP